MENSAVCMNGLSKLSCLMMYYTVGQNNNHSCVQE